MLMLRPWPRVWASNPQASSPLAVPVGPQTFVSECANFGLSGICRGLYRCRRLLWYRTKPWSRASLQLRIPELGFHKLSQGALQSKMEL